jgi:O-antigen/teichoic acid export membrane protein
MVKFLFESSRRPTLIHISQNLLATLLNVLLIFMLTKYCSVEEFGLYTFLKSVSSILDYSHLGTRYGLDTELINNKDKADHWVESVNSLVVLFGGGIVLFLFIFYNQLYHVLFILSGYLFSIITTRRLVYRASGNEILFVKFSILQNIVPLIVQILCLLLMSFKFLALAYFLSIFVIFIFTKQYSAILRFKLIDFKTIAYLIYKGKVLFIFTGVAFIFNGFDRIILSNYLEDKLLGYYGFIFTLIAMISIVPMSISELVMSKLLDRSNTDRWRILIKSIKIFSLVSLCTMVLIFISLSFVLFNFFPDYVSLEFEIFLSLICVLPVVLQQPLQLYLISLNDEVYLMYTSLFFGIFFLITLGFYSMYGFGSLKILILIKIVFLTFYFLSSLLRVLSKKVVYG